MQVRKAIKTAVASLMAAALVFTSAPVNVSATSTKSTDYYVLVNIPYNLFYEDEINNGSDVQAVSSATTDHKTRNYSLNGGTYHQGSGDDWKILGITYPVKMSEEEFTEYKTFASEQGAKEITADSTAVAEWAVHGTASSLELTGAQVLFESPSYSYYVLNDTADSYYGLTSASVNYYKTLGDFSEQSVAFGKDSTPATAANGAASLATTSGYGDYQLSVNGLSLDSGVKVLGLVLNTTDGNSYALRHLENIWSSGKSLAWTAGITNTEKHGNDLSYMADYYKPMVGKTLSSLTYYTSAGILTYTLDSSLPVLQKIADFSVTQAEDTTLKVGDTSVAVRLNGTVPDDYVPVFTVDNQSTKVMYGSPYITLVLEQGLSVGNHTVTLSDGRGKYASYSANVVAYTDAMPAQYDATNKKIVKADDATEEDFSAYLAAISKVTVNGTSYAASGKRATKIVGSDGSIDLSKVTVTEDSFTISVEATGYSKVLEFTYVQKEAETPSQETVEEEKKEETSPAAPAATEAPKKSEETTSTTGESTATSTASSTSSDSSSSLKKPAKVKKLKLKRAKNKKKMTVSWKKVSGASGYQIQYSIKANFKSAKKVTVKKASKVKATIKKLKKGKKYYVRVRAYKTADGTKAYGAWSAKKKA